MTDPLNQVAQGLDDLIGTLSRQDVLDAEKSVGEHAIPPSVGPDNAFEKSLRHDVAEASDLFDEMCHARHEYGQKKYDEFTFIEAPTLQMALEEIADLANYARYTFIKVWLLRSAIQRAQVTATQKVGGVTGGFISTRDIMGAGEG